MTFAWFHSCHLGPHHCLQGQGSGLGRTGRGRGGGAEVLGSRVHTSLLKGGRNLFLVGCMIFLAFIKNGKSSSAYSCCPPHPTDPRGVGGRAWRAKQGLLWLQGSHDALHHNHLAALGHWGQGGQAPDSRVLSSVLQVVETPHGLGQVLPALWEMDRKGGC